MSGALGYTCRTFLGRSGGGFTMNAVVHPTMITCLVEHNLGSGLAADNLSPPQLGGIEP